MYPSNCLKNNEIESERTQFYHIRIFSTSAKNYMFFVVFLTKKHVRVRIGCPYFLTSVFPGFLLHGNTNAQKDNYPL